MDALVTKDNTNQCERFLSKRGNTFKLSVVTSTVAKGHMHFTHLENYQYCMFFVGNGLFCHDILSIIILCY